MPLDAIVIGGGIAAAGDLLLNPIRERLRRGDILDAEVAGCIDVRRSQCDNGVIEGGRYLARQFMSVDQTLTEVRRG